MTRTVIVLILYLVASLLFILGIKGMTKVRAARRGNALSAVGMLIAIAATLLLLGVIDYRWILLGFAVGTVIGAISAYRVPMTMMPEMVALFNGAGGAASALVGIAYLYTEVMEKGLADKLFHIVGASQAITVALSILVGGITLSGSVVAYLQLSGKILSGRPVLLPGRHVLNGALVLGSLVLSGYLAFFAADPTATALWAWVLLGVALVLGVLLVIPIGGADMPVVISLLNSYSGIAAGMTGFVLDNNLLIISGALVGASGIILTKIMCDAMNRSLANVLFGGFGTVESAGTGGGASEYGTIRSYSAEDAALVLESAETVIIVPGYGLAVAQAQHTVRELSDLLKKRGTKVAYAIHPVAGRMPGHMNVLLAEADVPYEELFEMDKINSEFKNTDVVIVVGANDVVNPAAERTPGSPIYGMPVLKVWEARTIIMIKRSLGAGFAAIKNELFEADNTMMLFKDAKVGLQEMVSELKAVTKAA